MAAATITIESRNAVVLNVTFVSSEGTAVDVDNPTFIIYDRSRAVVDTITEGFTRGDDKEYIYIYDFAFDTGYHEYYVEATGTVDGHPVSARQKIGVRFDS